VGLFIARTGARRFPQPSWQSNLANQLLLRGRLREASASFEEILKRRATPTIASIVYAAELMSVGRMPMARFDSLYDAYAATTEQGAGFPYLVGVPYWIASGDTARLSAGLRRFAERPGIPPGDARLVTEFLVAAIALAGGDSSAFREGAPRDSRVAPGMRAETPFGIFPVEMELAMGREDEAWELLQSRGGGGPVTRVRWMLYRARLAEKRGERDIALENYGYVNRIWADAEEPLRSDAREAREALARLTAEQR
jgi:hypothetical protein